MSGTIIRSATPDDHAVLLELGNRMRSESQVSFPEIEPDAVDAYLRLTREAPDRFYVAIARRAGRPVGFVNGVIGPYAFSGEMRGCCDMLYVVPELRGSIAGARLLRGFRDWAVRYGAGAIYLGLSTGISPDRTGAFVQRLGYAPLGQIFRQEIK